MSNDLAAPEPSRPTAVPWSGSERPRVALLGAGNRSNVAARADELRSCIAKHAEVVCFDLLGELDLAEVEADFAIVLGGDGSMLRAAQQLGKNRLPVLGVNMGKLGYLAPVSPEQLDDTMKAVVAGRCRITPHLRFRSQVIRDGAVVHDELGLNESAILSGPPFRILNVDLYIDSELATTYSCDGLIISTPVGSTAHALSAGGPILRNDLQAFVVLPISPHTLTVRPIVDTADRVFDAVIEHPNAGTTLVVDGREVGRIQPNDRVRVERADEQFLTIEPLSQNYYRTLREKLGWGGMIRH